MQNLWNSKDPKHVLIVAVVFVVLALIVDSVLSFGIRTKLVGYAANTPKALSGMYFDMRNVIGFGQQAANGTFAGKGRDPEIQIVHSEGEVPITDSPGGEFTMVGTSTNQQDGLKIDQNNGSVSLGVNTETSGSSGKQPTIEELKKRPQFVVMAFDGSRSLQMWEKTLNFAEEMKQKGHPIHYTYFLNAVYFLDPAHYNMYQAPGQKVGVSNIGFATSKADVLARIAEVNRAIKDGHDIGSHNAGHFEGSKWTYEEWLGQLNLFKSIMFNLDKEDPDYKIDLKPETMIGFRAPDLGVNPHTYDALKVAGFTYDTSKVGSPTAWPTKDKNGLWQFSLPTILVRDIHTRKNRLTIGMDYNFYVTQTGAKDTLKRDTPAWNDAYQSVLKGYQDYFYKNYNGNRAPVYVANHFSYWNDGLYWDVMKDFAAEVCVLKDVQCVSFKELQDYMNSVSK